MRIARLTILALGCFSTVALADTETSRPCPMCDKRLHLSEAEWGCLQEQLPYYIGRSIEPFRIATVGCAPHTRGDVIPDTHPEPTRASATPPEPVTLSRQQLICLRDTFDKIAATHSVPIWKRRQPVDLIKLCGRPILSPNE